MDEFQRGRSLSTGNNGNRSHQASPHQQPQQIPPQQQHSPSPHSFYDASSNLSLDPSINSSTFTSNPFNQAAQNQASSPANTSPYDYSNTFANASNQSLPPQNTQGLSTDSAYFQSSDGLQSLDTSFGNSPALESNEQFPSFLDTSPQDFQQDFQMFANTSINQPSFQSPQMNFDPQMSVMQQSINPTELSRMPSPHNNAITPPNLRPPNSHAHSSPGRPASPSSNAGSAYYTPQHSRNQSLDPSSAAFPHGVADWSGVLQHQTFQGHRRAPSEHSEVSSVFPSPNLPHLDSFETTDSHSPLFPAQSDPALYDNALKIEQFTLSDTSSQRFSPAHSPYVSPSLVPQQGLGLIPDQSQLSHQANSQFNNSTPEIYMGHDAMAPQLQTHNSTGEIGQADSMAPPEINVEFAPPSRTNTFEPDTKPNLDFDALSPPASMLQRTLAPIERANNLGGALSRGRSKSDPYARTPSSDYSLSPSLGAGDAASPRSLSPASASNSAASSRSASPSGKSNRRQSTSSIENRNYILDLADPQRPGASATDSKRVQKHPATFQCHLCPKKFTRAYNLRSHLRTHTDERPFVCTVCGKAFARQHDRKRHEGLHSGEKKFVCRGELSQGGQWGCGRRFARADALGRHFRSEAGRICIKPLLDEEHAERQRQQMEHAQQQAVAAQQGLQPIPPSMTVPGFEGNGGFTFPAALLAQYPALLQIQWDQLANTADDPGDMMTGQRNSFDASSGGEFFEDMSDDGSGLGSGYVSGNSANAGGMNLGGGGGGGGWNQEWTG